MTIDINKYGQGCQKIFVISGGPGFNHRYMLSLIALGKDEREIIFYDQPGCGEALVDAGEINFTFYTAHLIEAIKSTLQSSEHTLIAHSFGSLLFAAALEKEPSLADIFQQVIFINPVPLEREEFDAASHSSFIKLPPELGQRVAQAFATGGAEGAEFEELMPYYFYDPAFTKHAPKLRKHIYFSVMATLGDFNYYSALNGLKKLDLVQSTHDIMHHDFIKTLREKAHKITTLSDLGHFPFIEDEKKTLSVLKMLMR